MYSVIYSQKRRERMKENPNHDIPFHSILNLPTYIIILLNVFKSLKNSKELILKTILVT